jgi:hypothetical protein
MLNKQKQQKNWFEESWHLELSPKEKQIKLASGLNRAV